MNLVEWMNWKRKLDQAPSEGSPGGNGSEPKAGSQPPQSANPPAPQTEGDGGDFDEFGYRKTPAAAANQAGKADQKPQQDPPTKPAATPPADGGVKGPSSTGYNDVDPETPPAAAAKPPESTPPTETPPAPADEVKVDVTGLSPEVAKEVQTFAKTHKLSAEQAKALADLRRAEVAGHEQAVNEAKAAAERQKANWNQELRNDPEFGRTNFKANVDRVDKLLEEFCPELKNRLTESKGMLPPYIMKGLMRVAQNVYSTANFTGGQPPVGDKEDKASPADKRAAELQEMYPNF